MSDTRLRYLTALGVAATLAGACNQMLGIDDAHVDGRLRSVDQAAGSAAGAAAGSFSTGGVGANGGTATSGTGGNFAGAPTAGSPSHGGGDSGTGGGNEGGDAGADETPSAGKGGTSNHAMGGTHSGSGSAGKPSDEHGGEAGDTSGPSGDPCDDYCDEVQGACTGAAEQYHDRAQCMKICHFFPLGDSSGEGDGADDNSVACRLKYVKKTQYGLGAEVTNYCRQAGPSGDGTCGTPCQAFCTVMMQVCTPGSAPESHFASEEECLATCDALPPAAVHYSDTDPAVSDGNHALCRLFHVNSAAMADELEHCEHAMGHTLCEAAP